MPLSLSPARRGRAVVLAAASLALAACGGGDATAPTPRLDAERIDRAVNEAGQILGQPVLWAVAALPLDAVLPVAASLRAAALAAPATAVGRAMPAGARPPAARAPGASSSTLRAVLRAPLPATAALSSGGPSLPPALIGRVYDFDPGTGTLAPAAQQAGAPPNGMRVRIVPGGGQMIGFVDLRDQSSVGESVLTIAVVDIVQRVAVYSGSMRSTVTGTAASATIQARVINPLVPGKEVRVAVTQQTTGLDGPAPRTAVALTATAPSLQAETGMTMPMQAGDRVRLTARVADRTIVFESPAERQPDGSYEAGATAQITVDGAAYGSASSDAQGEPVFRTPRGQPMSEAEREPVERLRGGLEEMVSVALVSLVLALLPAMLLA